jgi:hypothetical protein
MKWTRRTAVTMLTAALAVTGLAVPAASAQGTGTADVPVTAGVAAAEMGALAGLCWRFDCTGKDPQSKNCSTGGRDLKAIWATRESLQLRFGPACDAMWARVTMGQTTPNDPFFYKRRAKVERQEIVASNWRTVSSYEVVATGDSTKWTKMVPNYNYDARVRACWRLEFPNGRNSEYECTAWYDGRP